ncbi:hypothetical protein PsorP6_003919 [Peronosclerospora sorghi]|uniref:Uncharacterized protein n=1 Tax=Peronosclerospora sorghi TaxID=230839 RepID=A0ACC0VL23_9STRA|nr:hypothetical protein PsorP6_003919 [Peronosclerospora sorghi]
MKPPRTLYLYYYAIFAAVCISLLTCVSVEAATAVSPPKNTSRHGPTQKEAQQFHSTTVATNNEARAPITEITDNLLKKGTSFKNPITFENPDTTENLLAKYNSFKATETSDNQAATSQSNKKRRGNGIELDLNKKPKLSGSVEDLDEDTMLLMIVGAEKPRNQDTGLTREDLESYLLEEWEDHEATLDSIFDKPSDATFFEILKHPIPNIWLTFGKKISPDPCGLLLEKLTVRYGEDGLARRLVEAQKQSGDASDSLATQLMELKFEKWNQEKQSVRGILKNLKPRGLKDPALQMLFSYLSLMGKNPYAVFMKKLRKKPGEVELARLLALEEQDGGYLDIVKGLEFFQFTQWKLAGKYVIDAFKYLGINKGGPGVSHSSLWYAWVSYVKYLLSVKNLSEDTLRGMISETQTPVTKALHDQGTTSQVNKKRKRNDVELNSNMNTNLVESWWKNLNEGTMLLMIVVTKDHVVPGLKREDIESFLLTKWEKDGETFDGIFDKISDDEYVEILNHPTPQVWLTFGEKVGQNPYGVLLKKLTLRYGEDGLAKRLSCLGKREEKELVPRRVGRGPSRLIRVEREIDPAIVGNVFAQGILSIHVA